jgi:ABC-type molybdate transport system permease subunit
MFMSRDETFCRISLQMHDHIRYLLYVMSPSNVMLQLLFSVLRRANIYRFQHGATSILTDVTASILAPLLISFPTMSSNPSAEAIISAARSSCHTCKYEQCAREDQI